MKFILFTLFLLSFSLYPSFQEEISSNVINGEDARIEDHPYMAHVYSLMLPTCGGSILTRRSVLTAAHCLIFRISQPALVFVVVGTAYRDGTNGTRYRSARILLHPDYVPGPNVYDIGIVNTVRAIEYGPLVQPIPLATDEYIGVGVPGVFTGWGFIGYGGILPRRAVTMQKMYTRTISNDDCRERYSVTHRGDYIYDQKLCVVSGPRTSVCGGDSGGPLVIDGRVAGVISWRTFPCGDGLPDVFIRISAARDWINSVVIFL
ncbi:chymotrypsin-2-like [Chironomus tepperi]|uniref:chymotrypsin-2-like n=1 Tax=Chironomus tepperi TaxID=113505 RepID=UPI00391EE968